MDEFFKKLKTLHKPTQTEPWFEFEYIDYPDFNLFLEFVDRFDNIAKLRQEDQPFALYFSVFEEPMDRPGAVWIVHAEPLWGWMDQKYPDPELRNEDTQRAILGNRESFIEFGLHRARPQLSGYDPDRKSERVTAQRGVLTVCEQLFVDHAVLIGSALMDVASEQSLPLFKIMLSPEAKAFFRQYLSKLNISAATLFPGIDGLGRTIAETIQVCRDVFRKA